MISFRVMYDSDDTVLYVMPALDQSDGRQEGCMGCCLESAGEVIYCQREVLQNAQHNDLAGN